MAKDESTKGFLDSDKWRKRVPSIVKSLMDLILASVCLGLCLPLFVLIALAIKIDSPGPVFSSQKWIDEYGGVFILLGFRSMKANEGSHLSSVLIKNGSRLTRVGAIIVKLRIDEIPRLINIIRGEISLLHPTPIKPYLGQ